MSWHALGLILALLIAVITASQITAIRSQETDGHLETLLVRLVSRTAWLAERVGLATGLLLAAGVVGGIGMWAGAATQRNEIGLGSLVEAGLNVVPPALFLLGLGTLLLGVWPRAAGRAVYGYLAWSFLVEFVGGAGRTNHWILDTSVFFHTAPPPPHPTPTGRASPS